MQRKKPQVLPPGFWIRGRVKAESFPLQTSRKEKSKGNGQENIPGNLENTRISGERGPNVLVRASREKAGYTQAAAAKHVHLLYEAGTSAPPFGIVCRMADLYHCSPADFRLMEYRPK